MKEIAGIEYTDNLKTIIKAPFDISEVNLLDSTEIIYSEAFKNSKLSKIKFPKSLHDIGEKSFMGTLLNNLIIEHNVAIGKMAFAKNFYLNNINICCEMIPDSCFYNCGGFKGNYMNIELNLTKIIGPYAFKCCCINNFTVKTNQLIIIEDGAFEDCKFKNKEFIVPEGVRQLGKNVFDYSGITDVYLPDSVKDIGNLQSSNIKIHISEITYNRLLNEGKISTSKNIKIIGIDELLDSFTFKEINDYNLKISKSNISR